MLTVSKIFEVKHRLFPTSVLLPRMPRPILDGPPICPLWKFPFSHKEPFLDLSSHIFCANKSSSPGLGNLYFLKKSMVENHLCPTPTLPQGMPRPFLNLHWFCPRRKFPFSYKEDFSDLSFPIIFWNISPRPKLGRFKLLQKRGLNSTYLPPALPHRAKRPFWTYPNFARGENSLLRTWKILQI